MDTNNNSKKNKENRNVKWSEFLHDVFICALGSYGGPEAHYGVFSQILVNKKKYISEEELTEMIGLFALVPGPASTQTITAIGYHVGGPILAILTFLLWVLPAICIMSLFGIFISKINNTHSIKVILTFLPSIAISFIIYAALKLSKKVLKEKSDIILYLIMLITSLLLVKYSMWVVPIILILGGFITYFNSKNESDGNELKGTIKKLNAKWYILMLVLLIAIVNEMLSGKISSLAFNLFSSFYRYGYSVIGGGQILIPLMIQDFVNSQSLISLGDFLSGYAIDQAIPGPLFSFAAFVGSRATVSTNTPFLYGVLSGLSIFLPGILLVFFIFPIWKTHRNIGAFKKFLKGISITAASLIAMTAITQIIKLPINIYLYIVVIVSTLLLIFEKIPAPIIVMFFALLGFLI